MSAGSRPGYEFPVSVLEACVGVGCRGRGTEFLVIPKNKSRPDPTLTGFRPEPGFFDWGSMIP
jgi:hypothetical protein